MFWLTLFRTRQNGTLPGHIYKAALKASQQQRIELPRIPASDTWQLCSALTSIFISNFGQYPRIGLKSMTNTQSLCRINPHLNSWFLLVFSSPHHFYPRHLYVGLPVPQKSWIRPCLWTGNIDKVLFCLHYIFVLPKKMIKGG